MSSQARPSHLRASTATSGAGTCSGGPTDTSGSSTRRLRMAAIGRPTWQCCSGSARRIWRRSSRRTTRSARLRRDGGTASRCTSCTRCSCTRRCSVVHTVTAPPRLLGPSCPSSSVEAELVAFDVLHNEARLVEAVGDQQLHARRAKRDQSGAFGFERGHAFVTDEPSANAQVEMHPVFHDLAFGHALEEQSRAHTRGIDTGECSTLSLSRQRAIEVAPARKPFRRWRHYISQRLTPKESDALRICAVESDLKLLDRRHPPTLKDVPRPVPRATASVGVPAEGWPAGRQ